MLTGHEPLRKRLWNAYKLTAEEEFYRNLNQNRVWPFIDLGNHYYYLVYRSNRLLLGLLVILGAITCAAYFFIISGVYSFPLCAFIICFILGTLVLSEKVSKRELILNKSAGYLLRLAYTRNVLVEENIYNVYIRLQQKIDSSQKKHFYVIVGGYLLEDIRITRNTRNEQVMKVLGRYLAHNLGINYFDHHDETVKHEVYHFREQGMMQERDSNADRGYENKYTTEMEGKALVRFKARDTIDKAENTGGINQNSTDNSQQTDDLRKRSQPTESAQQTNDTRNSSQQTDGHRKRHKRRDGSRKTERLSDDLQRFVDPAEAPRKSSLPTDMSRNGLILADDTREKLKQKRGHHRKPWDQTDNGKGVSYPRDAKRETSIQVVGRKMNSRPAEVPRRASQASNVSRKRSDSYEGSRRKSSDGKGSREDENTNRNSNPHNRKRRRKRNSVAPQDKDGG